MKIKLKARVRKAEEIPISTEFIKLDSFLKLSNTAETGGMAKELIAEGLVKVNGQVCTQRGRKLRPGDTVSFQGIELAVTAQDEH